MFCSPSMQGPASSTLGIAKDLRRPGHRVLYCGFADGQEFIQQNGFEFTPIFSITESFFGGYREFVRAAREVRGMINNLVQGQDKNFDNFISATNPDLFIIESSAEENILWALLAHSHGIPFLYLNSSIDRPFDRDIPPVTSHLIPKHTWLNKAAIFFAWRKAFLYRAIDDIGYRLLGVHAISLARQFADQYGYPPSKIDKRYVIPRLTASELILLPREFDFVEKEVKDVYYVGPCLDLTRHQSPFSWNQINDKKPIVYCALGSLSNIKQSKRKTLLTSIVQAASLSGDSVDYCNRKTP